MTKTAKKNVKKVALVTGSAKGVGSAIAKDLTKSGYTVVVHYKASEAAAKKTLTTIRRQSPKSSMLTADLRDPEQVKKMIKLVVERYGRLDVLINNVGNFIYKPLAKTSSEEWDDVMETNVSATFYTCRYALPQMRKQKFGRIVNFGAVSADRMIIRPNTTPYYIAKTGVIMLTKQLAADNAKYGITINAVSPGILESSIVKPKTPTGQYIKFGDITNTIRFLLDKKSSAVNGTNLEVSDGFSF